MLALIVGKVSYLHVHLLVEPYGQPGGGAPTPLSADSRSGGRGGFFSYPGLAFMSGSASLMPPKHLR